MGEIDPVENSIQTSEKPVEGVHGQWKQYSPPDRSGSDEGKEMGLILKGMLRNDPDVILVGEIRDEGVAKTAIQGAKTGHLVFTTLHVDHAAQTPSRLAGLGVDPQDIASTLKLVIAQRLVRKVCTSCAVPDTRESTMKNLKAALDTYLKSIGAPKILRARDGGCPSCRGTGYRGRTMAYELLRVNRKIRGMIEAGTTTMKLEEAAIGKGKSMWHVGLRYVATGVTSMDELLRSVPHDEVN
jgi:type II secretory ATPase GspE/PulE/Tfp pilus assembly ATPase PilB-like protein